MQLNISLFFFLFLAGVCACLEGQEFLQRLIDQLQHLSNDKIRESHQTGSGSDSSSSGLQDHEKSAPERDEASSQKSFNDVLKELRRLLMINKRDHVVPAVDLSHFSCTQEYYGLRKLVDNLAKKYCVVKDDHVHDSMDGL